MKNYLEMNVSDNPASNKQGVNSIPQFIFGLLLIIIFNLLVTLAPPYLIFAHRSDTLLNMNGYILITVIGLLICIWGYFWTKKYCLSYVKIFTKFLLIYCYAWSLLMGPFFMRTVFDGGNIPYYVSEYISGWKPILMSCLLASILISYFTLTKKRYQYLDGKCKYPTKLIFITNGLLILGGIILISYPRSPISELIVGSTYKTIHHIGIHGTIPDTAFILLLNVIIGIIYCAHFTYLSLKLYSK